MKHMKNPLIIAASLIGIHYLDLLLSGHWLQILLLIFGVRYLWDLVPEGHKTTIQRMALNLRHLWGSDLLPTGLKESVQRAVQERQEIGVYSDHDGPISPEGADYFRLRPSRLIIAVLVLLRALGVRTAIVTGRGLSTILRYPIYRVAFESAIGALGYEFCADLSSGHVENKPVPRNLKTAFARMREDIDEVVEERDYQGFGMDVRGDIAGLNCFVSNVKGGLARQAELFAEIERIVERHFIVEKMDVFYHRPGQSEQPRIDVHLAGLTRTGKGAEVKELHERVHSSALAIVVADDVPKLLQGLREGAHEVMDPLGGGVFGIEVAPKRLTFERVSQEHLIAPGQVGYFLVLWQIFWYVRQPLRRIEPKNPL